MLQRNIISPSCRHTASLIFLHGAHESGPLFQAWTEECFDRVGDRQGFSFEHVKVIHPTAPMQPYTNIRRSSSVWFNREKIAFDSHELVDSIDIMAAKLTDIIKTEMGLGIPANRIIVGGFSMGGTMALHMGYRHHSNLRGVFGLSSFLNEDSPIYDAIIKAKQQHNSDVTMPELFMTHGSDDDIAPYQWGHKTFDRLKSCGVKGQFHTFPYRHEIGTEQLTLLRKWVQELLPDDAPSSRM